jgi:hypothetical protein
MLKRQFIFLFLLIGLALIFKISPAQAVDDYCIWSPIINASPKAGEDACNLAGEPQYFLMVVDSACSGKTPTTPGKNICCCQVKDHPGQCLIDKDTCPSGEYCFEGYCQKPTAATAVKTKTINPLDKLQVKIPGLENIAKDYSAECAVKDGKTSCALPWIAVYIKSVFNYALGVIGILAAIAIMIGGVIWLVSAGNATRISQAQSWIGGAITGLLIMFTSYILLNQINPELVGLKSINIGIIDELPDADVTTLGAAAMGANPYQAGCTAARNGDFSVCSSYGQTRPSDLIDTGGGNYLSAETFNKLDKAFNCVKDKNNGQNKFSINEAWRSAATQISYYQNLPKGRAATPCCSNHGSGQAVDLKSTSGAMSWSENDSSGLKTCMNANGLYASISSEPWHWSPTGY